MDPTTKKLPFDIEPLIRKDEAYVTTTNDFSFFYSGSTTDELVDDFFKDKSTYEIDLLISTSEEMLHGEVKVLIMVAEKFYHFFVDSLSLILKVHKSNPEVRFVLYLQRAIHSREYENFLILLFKILDGEGVTYTVISTLANQDLAPVYRYKNYVLLDDRTIHLHEVVSMVDVKYAAEISVKYSKHHDVPEHIYNKPPLRKVYLTRGGRGRQVAPTEEGYEYYKDDLRMHDEDKLERFFAEKGYEIIEPETKFKTIMEQIAYMRQVKTLVSVTSSGLTNMLFMQPNQTVIEIQVEIVQQNGTTNEQYPIFIQRLHPFYQVLSFIKEHTFLSIPSHRDPDIVIETLTGDWMGRVL